jgi:hypothetical protein
MKGVVELSLRPYHGKLHVCNTRKAYEKAHKALFKTADILTCAQHGRFCAGEGLDGMWTYIVYADNLSYLSHELAHVLFHVFKRCGIKPGDSGGEAFCYMLSQLMIESNIK